MSGFTDKLSELLGRYPIDEGFIEELRQHVRKECMKVPVQAYNRDAAQRRLEIAAREAIVVFWQGKFEDAWFPITLRPNWPVATCIIEKNEAVVEFSIGPETDGSRGGQEIEPVRFPVVRKPPNIISRAIRAFESRDLKAERAKELNPTGTPDGRPELKLKAAAPKSDSQSRAKPRLPAKGRS